jgi:choline transport protein
VLTHTTKTRIKARLTKNNSVRPGWDIPLNAVYVSFVVTCLLSLINLGSAVAFNAIVSLTVGAILSSYIISISCVALRRIRNDPLPHARWSLGRAGLACNIIAVLFLLLVYVFAFFPLAAPVVPETMNWSILIYGSVLLLLVWTACIRRSSCIGE